MPAEATAASLSFFVALPIFGGSANNRIYFNCRVSKMANETAQLSAIVPEIAERFHHSRLGIFAFAIDEMRIVVSLVIELVISLVVEL